jgi:hypothetical protein
MWKEAVVVYFMEISPDIHGSTKESHENPHSE